MKRDGQQTVIVELSQDNPQRKAKIVEGETSRVGVDDISVVLSGTKAHPVEIVASGQLSISITSLNVSIARILWQKKTSEGETEEWKRDIYRPVHIVSSKKTTYYGERLYT